MNIIELARKNQKLAAVSIIVSAVGVALITPKVKSQLALSACQQARFEYQRLGEEYNTAFEESNAAYSRALAEAGLSTFDDRERRNQIIEERNTALYQSYKQAKEKKNAASLKLHKADLEMQLRCTREVLFREAADAEAQAEADREKKIRDRLENINPR